MRLITLILMSFSMLFACQEQQSHDQKESKDQQQAVPNDAASNDNATSQSTIKYQQSTAIAGSSFHGVHGLEQGPDGLLYAGSVLGQAIYQVDPTTGKVNEFVSAPQGMADDLTFDKQGNLYWTAFNLGKVFKRTTAGDISVLAEGLPGINAIAFHPDGRLFATRVFLGDNLYEIDLNGVEPAREIMSGMGGLNGFDFSDDGYLYGPLWFKGQIVKVDVDKASLTVIADGFDVPSGVEFSDQGELFMSDSGAGEIYHVDINNGKKTLISKLANNIDNLTVGKQGQIFATNMTDNAIIEVAAPTDGQQGLSESRVVVQGRLASPAGIAADDDYLYIADAFSLRRWSYTNDKIDDIERLVDKHHYPMMSAVNSHSIITTSWFSGTVISYDKASLKQSKVVTGLAQPYGLHAFDDGRILVAEYGKSCLTEIVNEQQTCLLDKLQGPIGVAVDTSGLVYISESDSGSITIYDPKTKARSVFLENLNLPEGIALDGEYLIVAEVGAKRLLRVSLSDQSVDVIAQDLPLGLSASAGTPQAYMPTGVSVKSGEIYLSSDITNAVYKFSPQLF